MTLARMKLINCKKLHQGHHSGESSLSAGPSERLEMRRRLLGLHLPGQEAEEMAAAFSGDGGGTVPRGFLWFSQNRFGIQDQGLFLG